MNQNPHWHDQPIYPPTVLLNHLPTASKERGIRGKAKSAEGGPLPWSFHYPPEVVDGIPRRNPKITEYLMWDDTPAQPLRLGGLTDEEFKALFGQTAAEAERRQCEKYMGP